MNGRTGSYTGGYNNNAAPDGLRRKHAGETKVGLPLIMTGGRKRWDEFHYQFTDREKFKKQPRPGEVELTVSSKFETREMANKIKFKLPRHFCPDCNRNDRAHEQGAINMWTMYDGAPEFGLLPEDVVITFWCQECQMAALYGKQIVIPGMEQGIDVEGMDEWRKKQIRNIRMDRNIESFIRNRLAANDSSIIVSEELRKQFANA